jgi:hypothetical protein
VIAASIRLHGATSQTTVLFILAAMGSWGIRFTVYFLQIIYFIQVLLAHCTLFCGNGNAATGFFFFVHGGIISAVERVAVGGDSAMFWYYGIVGQMLRACPNLTPAVTRRWQLILVTSRCFR